MQPLANTALELGDQTELTPYPQLTGTTITPI